MPLSALTTSQRYAAAALLGLALRRVQIDLARPINGQHLPNEETFSQSDNIAADDDCDCSQFWTHKSQGLLRPVFQFLDVDSKAWPGLEKAAASAPAKDHALTFLKIISEDDNESSSQKSSQERVLAVTVDSMAMRLETDSASAVLSKKKYESQSISNSETMHKTSEDTFRPSESLELTNYKMEFKKEEQKCYQSSSVCHGKSILGGGLINYQRKVTVLFELLSACVADTPEGSNESPRLKKGYDARLRTALRLLAIWLDIKWIKMWHVDCLEGYHAEPLMIPSSDTISITAGQLFLNSTFFFPLQLEAMEIMVACSGVAVLKEEGAVADESESENSTWSKWKRGGIIGAAALTGGTLMAITGGLAAPAIAAGVSALAPTLGSLIPVIGASGFAAVATAAGSAAGSVAVAASLGAAGAGLSGSKMARRMGSIEEFEFKNIGDNHNQGQLAVGIFISGFVFEEEDFTRPWERINGHLERFALLWESQNIIAVSTAIQDWLKSKLTVELMKQGAMMTVLGTLVSAFTWPTTLLSALDFIDSKWSIAIDRADKAGLLLAEVLSKNLQGDRPVTLVGFSLGARVIFKCLQQMAESGEEGIVEKVVLLGAPISSKGNEWESARKIVAGRFVNVFSTNDWILGVTFRAILLSQGLAGIQTVDYPGIENVDVTHLIDGHSSYLWAMPEILQQLELNSYYAFFLSAPTAPKDVQVKDPCS